MDRLIPMPNSFYEALANVDAKNMKHVYITEHYVDMNPDDDYDEDQNIIYDADLGKALPINEWSDVCAEANFRRDRERMELLEKAGLKNSFLAVKAWLASGDTIHTRNLNCDDAANSYYYIEKHDLRYGYRITGFHRYNNDIIWEIAVYDRIVRENDVERGKDHAYLLYDGNIHEVDYKSYDELVYINDNEDDTRGARYRVFIHGLVTSEDGRQIRLSIPCEGEWEKEEEVSCIINSVSICNTGHEPGISFHGSKVVPLNGMYIYHYTYDKFKTLGGKVFEFHLDDKGEIKEAIETDETFSELFPGLKKESEPVEITIERYVVKKNFVICKNTREIKMSKHDEIYEKYKNGETDFEVLGKEYGVTRERIRQIVEKKQREEFPLKEAVANLKEYRRMLENAAQVIVGNVDNDTLTQYNGLVKGLDSFVKRLNCICENKGEKPVYAEKVQNTEIPNTPLYALSDAKLLLLRTVNALHRAGIHTTKDLLYVTPSQLGNIRNFGKKAVEEITVFCKNNGIEIGSKVDIRGMTSMVPIYTEGDRVVSLFDKAAFTYPPVTYKAETEFKVVKVNADSATHKFSMRTYMCAPCNPVNKNDEIIFSLNEIKLAR